MRPSEIVGMANEECCSLGCGCLACAVLEESGGGRDDVCVVVVVSFSWLMECLRESRKEASEASRDMGVCLSISCVYLALVLCPEGDDNRVVGWI